MSTYESTISLMNGLPEADLLLVNEFIRRLTSKAEEKREMYNPYKPLTREEIIEQLSIARGRAREGKVMPARQASDNIRKKYGL